jgi:hypothetical protein
LVFLLSSAADNPRRTSPVRSLPRPVAKKNRTSFDTIHVDAPTPHARRLGRHFSAIFTNFGRFTWPLSGMIPQNRRFNRAVHGKIPLVRRFTRHAKAFIAVFSRSDRHESAIIGVPCRSNRQDDARAWLKPQGWSRTRGATLSRQRPVEPAARRKFRTETV